MELRGVAPRVARRWRQLGAKTDAPEVQLAPMHEGLPVVGSALDLWRRPFDALVAPYLEHGPIFRIRLPGSVYTVLAGPEASRLVSEDSQGRRFCNGPPWAGFAREVNTEVLLTALDGPAHASQRVLQKHGFSRQVFVERWDEMVEIVERSLAELEPGQELSVLALARRVIFRQLSTLTIGASADELLDDLIVFVNTVLGVTYLRTRPRLALHDPRYLRAKRRAWRFIDGIYEQRLREGSPHRDLTRDVMRAYARKENFRKRDELRMAMLGPLVAGLDTAANTACFATAAALRFPDVLLRVRRQVDGLIGDEPLTEQGLRMLTAVHGLLMETMRVNPVASMLLRVAGEDFEFRGYRILAGEPLMLGCPVAHFLPRFYRSPEIFDIDRFAAPRREHSRRFAFVPYGAGPHTCLGARLAELQLMLFIALFTRRLEVEPACTIERLRVRIDPAPTYGDHFRVRILRRRS